MITKGNFGGAQRYVFDLATHLPKDRFDVTVACGEGQTLKEKLREAHVRVIEIPSLQRDVNIWKDISSFFEITSIIRRERPDVLHLNSSKMGGLGALVGRLLGIPKIIFTGHGWAFNEERNIFSKAVIASLHWLTILLCHITIAVSRRVEDQITRFPFVRDGVVQIYNGIDTIKFAGTEEARKKLAPRISKNFWIGTISELHKNKGLDFLIEAFVRLAPNYPNAVCVVVGEGEERRRLEKLIEKHHLSNRVFLLGSVADAAQYLKAFDIFTLTSRTEAFPYAPMEAGLAELPVVASWAGGIPEIITNGESGVLVDPTDTEMLSRAFQELIQNEKARNELGKNLKEKIEREFSLSKILEKTIRLYENNFHPTHQKMA